MKSRNAESIIEFPIATSKDHPSGQQALSDTSLPSVLIGRLVGLDGGKALVTFPGSPDSNPIQARIAAPLSPASVGNDVTLAFADGDRGRPVILGVLGDSEVGLHHGPSVDVKVDGERLVLTAQKEIVLRCGDASLTLTAAGKVLIKGNYVLSRSSGYNKIKGAAVDIN